MIIGLVAVVVGVIALLIKLGVLEGSVWSFTWPVVLIVVGLYFILGGRRHHGMWGGCCGWPRHDEEKKQ